MEKMNILMIDTSNENMKISLNIENKKVFIEKNQKHGHVENLLPAIDKIFKKIAKNKNELNFIGVCEGPGSFTGLRIGISAALGIGFRSDIKCFGFSAFDVYKYLFAKSDDSVVVPIIDARKERYYTTFITNNNEYEYFDINEDDIIDKIKKYRDRKIIFVGKDFEKVKDRFKEKTEFSYEFSNGYGAKELLDFSGHVLSEGSYNKDPKPIYLRKSEAELSLIKKKMASEAGALNK